MAEAPPRTAPRSSLFRWPSGATTDARRAV